MKKLLILVLIALAPTLHGAVSGPALNGVRVIGQTNGYGDTLLVVATTPTNTPLTVQSRAGSLTNSFQVLKSNGLPAFAINSNGAGIFGTPAAATNSDVGGTTFFASLSPLYIGYSNSASDAITIDSVSGDSSGIALRRAQGSYAAMANMQLGQQIGYIDFRAFNTDKFWNVASIAGHVDAATVAGQRPASRLIFATGPNNGTTTERMRIDKDGAILINVGAGLAGFGSAKLAIKQTDGTADFTTLLRGSTNSGGSYGLRIDAGTTVADGPIALFNTTSSQLLFQIFGNGMGFVSNSFGIGDSTPDATLDVESSVATVNVRSTQASQPVYCELINDSGNVILGKERAAGGGVVTGSSPYAGVLSVQTSHPLQFGAGSVIRMTLDATGNFGIGTNSPQATLHVHGSAIIRSNLTVSSGGTLQVGPTPAVITNILAGSATLDFAAQTLGSSEDLPITVTGAAIGDFPQVSVPPGSATGIIGSYSWFASNGVVFVRFISTGTAQDPASGTFKALVTKVQ